MRVALVHLVVNQSMAVSITSHPQQLNQAFGYAIQAVFTTSGTLGGTLKLQASVNHQEDSQGVVQVDGNWDDITDSSVLLTGAGSYTWNVTAAMYPYVRIIYTPAGGDTGVLNVNLWERAF